MKLARIGLVRLLGIPGAGLVAALLLTRPAGASLVDDFGDGDDVGWTHVDGLAESLFGPTIYDATSGAYNIRPTNPLFQLPILVATGSFWTPSLINPAYSNGTWETTVRAGAATNMMALMRFNPVTGNGYAFAFNPVEGGVAISRLDGMGFTAIAGVMAPTSFDEDYQIQATAVGSDLALKLWKLGDPEPVAPTITASDPTHALGAFALAVYNQPGLPEGSSLTGWFDNVMFVPEPSVCCLLGVGALLMLSRRPHSAKTHRS